DAALDPDLWTAFLSRLAAVLAAGMAHIVFYDETHVASAIRASVRSGPEIQKAYATRYCSHDPWAAPARARGMMRTGVAGVSQMLLPYRELVKKEFYHEYARPIGCVHGMTGMVLVNGPRGAGITLGRTDEKEPFGE